MEIYSYEKMKYLVSGHENKISALLSDMIKFNKRMEASEKLGDERAEWMHRRNYELLNRIEGLQQQASMYQFPCGDMDCDDCSHSPKHDDDCVEDSSFDPMDVEPGPDKTVYVTVRLDDEYAFDEEIVPGMRATILDVFDHEHTGTIERVDTPKPEPCADLEVVVFKNFGIESPDKYVSTLNPTEYGYTARIEDARKFRTMPEATAYAVEQGIGDVSFKFVDAAIEAEHVIGVGDLVTRGGSDGWVVTIFYPAFGTIRILCVRAGSESWDVSDQAVISMNDATLIDRAGEWGSW